MDREREELEYGGLSAVESRAFFELTNINLPGSRNFPSPPFQVGPFRCIALIQAHKQNAHPNTGCALIHCWINWFAY